MKDILASIATILKLVLDAKWKVVASIFLSILGFAMFVLWDERHHLLNIFLSQPLTLNIDILENNAAKYLVHSKANVLIVWKTNFSKNEKSPLIVETLNYGRLSHFENIKSPILTNNAEENENYRKIQNREIVCGPLLPTTLLGETLYKYDIRYLCRAGIPGTQQQIAGYITFAYKNEPGLTEKTSIGFLIKDLAQEIYNNSNN